MEFRCYTYTLKTKETFRTAHGSRNSIETLIVELKDPEKGIVGLGEALPVPYYGFTATQVKELLDSHQTTIEACPLESAELFWEMMKPHLGHIPFAQCALDIATYDYLAQKAQKPLYNYLNLSIQATLPVSNYTIGIDSIENMIAKMKKIDYPIYKIKLGTNQDVEIVKELRKYTNAIFRIDANCAWTAEQTIEYAQIFADLGVELIEQPLKTDNLAGMKAIIGKAPLPIIADENCIAESDVEKCKDYFDGINIKLAKCGGITPALRMIRRARELNMKVMMGCMTESSVGISAIAHLLPLLDYVDMDGALLMANDPADGVYLEYGKAIFTERNGLGVVMKI